MTMHVYEIGIRNCYLESSDKKIPVDHDLLTKTVAEVFKKYALCNQIITLHSPGSHSMGCYIIAERALFFTNTPLREGIWEEIKSAIRQLKKDLPKEYLKTLDRKEPPLAEMNFDHSVYTNLYLRVFIRPSEEEPFYPRHTRDIQITKFPIPSLSDGPKTGDYNDAWSHTFPSRGAQNWLESHLFPYHDIDRNATVAFVTKDESGEKEIDCLLFYRK